MVFRAGQPSHTFYVVVRGSVQVTVTGSNAQASGTETIIHENQGFGEAALPVEPRGHPVPRHGTAVTRERTWLLVFSRNFFRTSPTAVEHLQAYGSSQLAEDMSVADRLYGSGLFNGVHRPVLLQLAGLFAYYEAPPGSVIAEEGKRSTRFCIILQGCVVVSKRGVGKNGEPTDAVLAMIEESSEMPYFGENCILGVGKEALCGASVATREHTQLLCLAREARRQPPTLPHPMRARQARARSPADRPRRFRAVGLRLPAHAAALPRGPDRAEEPARQDQPAPRADGSRRRAHLLLAEGLAQHGRGRREEGLVRRGEGERRAPVRRRRARRGHQDEHHGRRRRRRNTRCSAQRFAGATAAPGLGRAQAITVYAASSRRASRRSSRQRRGRLHAMRHERFRASVLSWLVHSLH